MGNYVMQVEFFGQQVRCETADLSVSLTDLVAAGNLHRITNGLPIRRMQDITGTDGFKAFVDMVANKEGMPREKVLYATGRGPNSRTMAHYIVAIYVAEQLSVEFHYTVIKTFLEGKLLEMRQLGGTEFAALNAAVDLYLPDRIGKDNRGVYIQMAKLIRKKLLGMDAEAGAWATASVAQTHSRFELEKKLSEFMRAGLVRDWEHLKELIERG